NSLKAFIVLHLPTYLYRYHLSIQGFSKVSCEHRRLRRLGRFFAVSAPFAFPKGRQKAQKLQKRIVQRLCLCTNATFEKPCLSILTLLSSHSPCTLIPYNV